MQFRLDLRLMAETHFAEALDGEGRDDPAVSVVVSEAINFAHHALLAYQQLEENAIRQHLHALQDDVDEIDDAPSEVTAQELVNVVSMYRSTKAPGSSSIAGDLWQCFSYLYERDTEIIDWDELLDQLSELEAQQEHGETSAD